MFKFFRKFFKDANQKAIEKLLPLVELVNQQEKDLASLSDQEIKQKSLTLKGQVQSGKEKDLGAVLPEAFTLVREAAKRTLGQRHFDVQVLGGIVLSQGKIAEMKTGEGKTLAATLPAYLHGLTGKGVHIVTVNDYLAQRDAVWMGQIYYFLGLSVGCLVHEQAFLYDPDWKQGLGDKERDKLGGFKVFHEFLKPVERKTAYQADIVYGTNHQFGFDYLRDNLAYQEKDLVQRPLYFAIIDEVDSILIDEARTPLIISAPDQDATRIYKEFAKIIPRLKPSEDVEVEEKKKKVFLTEAGAEKLKNLLGRDIYEENNLVLIHHLEEALQANFLFQRDRDYVAKDGEIIIVDEFTGRLMHGRRYSGGLHQALEAKENLRVQEENRTMATVTIQNYFRLYPVLSGMTGTALSSAEEFAKVYQLQSLPIPTNKPMIRRDLPDKIFVSEKAKLKALVEEIKKRYQQGQPLLVGTISIEKNEYLSKLLKREGIQHSLLNAKNHEKEAEVIAQAGEKNAVTVATNMAGRGVDIILGGNPPDPVAAEQVKQLGGLHVIGTERHEARRIDDQLRGRAGRQGDSGSSQFFVSLEDELMRRFGSDRILGLIRKLNLPDDLPIENEFVSKAINSAQQKIEGFNFDIRKHILEYDDVLNKQREAFYRKRKTILLADQEQLDQELKDLVRQGCEFFFNHSGELKEQVSNFNQLAQLPEETEAELLKAASLTEIQSLIFHQIKNKTLPGELIKNIFLRTLDLLWMEQLEAMEHLRDTVALRSYGQRDSLAEYKHEGHQMFKALWQNFSWSSLISLIRIQYDSAQAG
ncbi:MAG: preprotein translocase subunit SecA [Patescibacteria group bacterium]